MKLKKEAKLYMLGETYIKFNFTYSEESKTRIKEAYLKQIGVKSKDFIKAKELITISIEYDKGSTKTRIIIWGTVVNIYLGIGNYGGFREGVRQIVNDLKDMSSYVIDEIDNGPSITPNNIINVQRRTGLPGRLDDLYKRVDSLERNLNNFSNNQIQTTLLEIKHDIADIANILSTQERNAFLRSLPNNYRHNLPQPDEKKTDFLYNKYALKPEDEIDIINH